MSGKPTRKELEKRIKELEKEAIERERIAAGAVSESDVRYRAVFDAIPASVIVIDGTGRITDINPYHIAEIGRGKAAKDDFIGKNLIEHPSIVNAGLAGLYKKALHGESLDRKDVYFPTTTGGEAGYFNVKGLPLVQDGEVIGAVTIHENITRRKMAEEELKKHRDHLEELVAERAADLKRSNEELRREIMEREQIEQTLKASERNYRELFNASNEAIFVHDMTTGAILDVNQTTCDIFGYPRHEMVRLNLGALSSGEPPYTLRNAEKWIEKAVEEGPQTFEWLSMRKNGKRFWAEVCLKSVCIGGRDRILAFVRDITDRKRIEEELRLDESRLSTLLKLNQMTEAPLQELTNFVLEEGIRLTKSKIGYLAFMNEEESVLTVHSWSKSAMKRCNIENKPFVYPIESTGLWGEAVRQRRPIITNDYQAPNPLKKGYPHGHVKIASHMNIPVFDGGRIVAVAGVGNKKEGYDASDVRQLTLLMDGMFKIIQRGRTEEEARRLRNLLGNIIDSMPSSIVAVDKDCNVTQWNLGAEKVTGLSFERTKGRALTDVFPGPGREMEKVRRAIDEGRTQKSIRVSHRIDDVMRLVDIVVYPLIDDDARGAVIRVDDVTEKAYMEEMMIQSEKMLSVGGLAAGMAHEIKNPLGGILQNTQVLKNRIFGDFPKNSRMARECGVSMEAMRSYMEKRGVGGMVTSIMESGVRAARIIENVLSFSHKSESRFSPGDLRDLMDQTVEIAKTDYNLKKKYDFRQIEIIREYDDFIPTVRCEGSELQQVYLNILKNGAEAMTEAGVESPCFLLRIFQKDGTARVEMEDNGPGMDEETRKRVFEPFYTTKGVGAGTGLGLSVSYFIITENHGGAISVESSPGKGARFIMELPM